MFTRWLPLTLLTLIATPAWSQSWSIDDVTRWAAECCVAASVLHAEGDAAFASIDRDDRSQCAQANLVRGLTSDVASRECQKCVADARVAFHQIVGLQSQRELLVIATQTTQQLVRFADKATELGIKDGSRIEYERKRLDVADQMVDVDAKIAKLRVALAGYTNRSFADAMIATMQQPSDAPEILASRDEAIASGRTHRGDLKAIERICRCLSTDTLPVARQAMSSLQPGIGIAIASSARRGMLASLHGNDSDSAEWCRRKTQCAAIRDAKQRQVDGEVLVAHIDYHAAISSLAIAEEQTTLGDDLVRQTDQAIEFGEATPGSDLLVKLDRLALDGKRLQRTVAVRVAGVQLDLAMGILVVPE